MMRALSRRLVVLPVVVVFGCSSASDQSGATDGGSGASGSGAAAGHGGTGGASARGGAGGQETAGAGGQGAGGGAAGQGAGGAAAGHGGAAGQAPGGAGGTSGAGGAGGSAAASPCAARDGLRFCDDFEALGAGATTFPAPWTTTIIGAGTISIDATTPAHSGTRSIKVTGGDADFSTMLTLHATAILPAPGGRLFARFYLRLGRPMSDGHNTYVIADPFAKPGTGNNLRLGEDYRMLMYTVMGDAHGALSNQDYFSDGNQPGLAFPVNQWTCVELLLDAGKPELAVWVDGAEVPDLHHLDFPLDSYDCLRFGFEKYAGPGATIWYDDVAVGTTRIGCN
jgi:hypothetical protein